MQQSGIYCITNTVNGKRYIGQSVDIARRWQQHVRTAETGKGMSVVHKAMREYGLQNFKFDVVLFCPRHDMTYWERYYILNWNTLCWGPNPQGYNVEIPDQSNTKYYASPQEFPDYVWAIINMLVYQWKPMHLTWQKIKAQLASYGVNVTLKEIREIDYGKKWYLDGFEYPLHSLLQKEEDMRAGRVTSKVELSEADVIKALGSKRAYDSLLKRKKATVDDFNYWRNIYHI